MPYKPNVPLITLTAIVLVLLFGELPGNSLFWREVQNLGHTFLFAVAAVLVLLLLRDMTESFRRVHLKVYASAGLISMLIGVLTEIVQLLMGRDSSIIDVMRDLAGIIAGLGIYACVDPYLQPHWLASPKRKRTGIAVLSFCVFTASLFPLASLSVAYVQRESAFPVVVDLTAKWSETFTRTKYATVEIVVDQKPGAVDKVKRLALVHFKRAIYPGVTMIELYPDWSSFEVLTLNIYSQHASTFDLVLRVHDKQHNQAYSDRFNRRLIVKTGANNFRIPLRNIKHAPASREMEMAKISELTLFSVKTVAPLSFYLSAVRLE